MSSGGGGGGSTTQKTVPWSGQQPYLRDLFRNAQSTYRNNPMQAYTGPRVAPLSQQTQAGINMLTNQAMSGSPYQTAFGDYLTNTLNQQNIDPNTISQGAQQAAGGIQSGQDLMQQAGQSGPTYETATAQSGAGNDLNFDSAAQFAGGAVNPYVQTLSGMGGYGSLGEASQFAGQPDPAALSAAQQSGQQATNIAGNVAGNMAGNIAANAQAGGSLPQAMQTAAGTINPAATSQLQQTASGEFLGSNPYLDQVYDTAAQKATQQFNENVMPSLAAQFSAGGRTGSGIQALATGRAAGDLAGELTGLAGDIYAPAYEAERNRQLQASGQLGQQGLGAGNLGADIYGTSGQLGLGAGNLSLGAGNLALGAGGLSTDIYGAQNQAELGRKGLASDLYLGERGLGQQAAQQAGQLSLGGGQLANQLYGTGSQADIARRQLASQNYNAGQDRALSAGQGLGQLGLGGLGAMGDLYGNIAQNQFRAGSLAPSAQQMGYNDINAMLQAGAIGEDQGQRLLDAQRAQFNEQQMAPWQGLQNYASVIQGLPGGYGTTTGSSSRSTGSRIGGALGGAMAGGQAFGPWGAAGGALLGGFL